MTITFTQTQLINGKPANYYKTDSIQTVSEVSRTGSVYFIDLGDDIRVRIENVKSIRSYPPKGITK